MKYGSREVLKTESQGEPGRRYVNAYTRCDCGREQWVRLASLKAGRSLECRACSNSKVSFKGDGVAAKNKVLREYKYSAARRGIEFAISDERFYELLGLPCFYCDSPPARVANGWKDSIVVGGIDRRDNSVGYTDTNVVPCCKYCNWIKHDKNENEFLEHVRKIYETSLDL